MNRNEKVARVILIIFGSVIMAFASLMLLMLVTIGQMDTPLYGIQAICIYLIVLCLLGGGYQLLGFNLPKMEDNKFLIHVLISMFTLAFVILLFKKLNLYPTSFNPHWNSMENFLQAVFYYAVPLLVPLAVIATQIIIGINLFKAEFKFENKKLS
jgi:hypothetical protein